MIKLIKDLGTRLPNENSSRKYRYGLYLCDCGVEFETSTGSVNGGYTKSCGCLKRKMLIDKNTKHGMMGHRLYNTWQNMIRRTSSKSNKSYKYYGGRGISVCSDWLNFKSFADDMYPSFKEGLTLDRIDNDGNYEPDNCRWTSRATQARNTRILRSDNTSGYRGVHMDGNKWTAKIRINRKDKHIGRFNTAREAGVAYDKYVTEHNLEHTRNGV